MEKVLCRNFFSLCLLIWCVHSKSVFKFRAKSTVKNLINSEAVDKIRSSLECSVICSIKNKNTNIHGACEAYSYDSTNKRCQLYKGTGNSSAVSVSVYTYKLDGVYGDWSSWGSCSTTCGGGTQTRNRVCKAPKHGGDDCVGPATESKGGCNTNPCPIPGNWLSWTEWSACPVTCGGDKRSRSRTCDMNTHGSLTAPCIGESDENIDCHKFPCSPLARTCAEWKNLGLTVNTIVDIDPDGSGALSPVKVACDVTSHQGKGVTVIEHDKETRTFVDNDATFVLNYEIAFGQVKAIVDHSQQCSQYVKWECHDANIKDNGVTVTTFIKRDKVTKADYFPGGTPGSHGCQCGKEGSCDHPSLSCNCDKNDMTWRYDEGFITDKNDLPMYAFVAEDTESNDENGYYTIGKLICFGTS